MGERRGTKALELWCRRMTEGYPGVKVDNMTTSWRDGLAFCAMIHHFRPDLIEFAKLNKADVYYNNELAFTTAEKYLGIPALLDAVDMATYEVPDRLSILTYLSQFYQVFAAQDSPNRLKRPSSSVSAEKTQITKTSGPPSKMAHVVGVPRRDPCQKCQLPVFLAERLTVGKKVYHRTCLKCARCGSQLTPGSFYETEVDDEYCCETCPDEEELGAGGDLATGGALLRSSAQADGAVNTSANASPTAAVRQSKTGRSSIADRLAFFEQGKAGEASGSAGNALLLQKSVTDEEKSKSLKRMEGAAVATPTPTYRMPSALSSFLNDTIDAGKESDAEIEPSASKSAGAAADLQMETSDTENESDVGEADESSLEQTLPALPQSQPPQLVELRTKQQQEHEVVPHKRFTATAQLQLASEEETAVPALTTTTTKPIKAATVTAVPELQDSASNSPPDAATLAVKTTLDSTAPDHKNPLSSPTIEPLSTEKKKTEIKLNLTSDSTTTLAELYAKDDANREHDSTNNNGHDQDVKVINTGIIAAATAAGATAATTTIPQQQEEAQTSQAINLVLSEPNDNVQDVTKDKIADRKEITVAEQAVSVAVDQNRIETIRVNLRTLDEESPTEDDATADGNVKMDTSAESNVEMRTKSLEDADAATTERLSVVRARLQQFEVIANKRNNNNDEDDDDDSDVNKEAAKGADKDTINDSVNAKLSVLDTDNTTNNKQQTTEIVTETAMKDPVILAEPKLEIVAIASATAENLEDEAKLKAMEVDKSVVEMKSSIGEMKEVPLNANMETEDNNIKTATELKPATINVETATAVVDVVAMKEVKEEETPKETPLQTTPDKVKGEEYPEDLNPFNSDDEDATEGDEENKENVHKQRSAVTPQPRTTTKLAEKVATPQTAQQQQQQTNLNPFDSSDDEVELEKSSSRNSTAASTPSGGGGGVGRVPPPRPPPPRISRNPFGEETDEDANFSRRSSLSSSLTKKTPVPTPRTNLDYYGSANSLGSAHTPHQQPPHLRRNSDVRGSNNSLTSSTGGTVRSRKNRKAPAPPAPLAKELFPPPCSEYNSSSGAADSSKASTPNSSTMGTPKMGRKKRPAPAPPKPARLDPATLPSLELTASNGDAASMSLLSPPKNSLSYPLQSEISDSKLSDEEKALLEGKQSLDLNDITISRRSSRRLIPLDASLLADINDEVGDADDAGDGKCDDAKQQQQQQQQLRYRNEQEESNVVYRRVLMPPSLDTPTRETNPLLDELHDRQLEKLKDNKEAKNRNRQSQISASSSTEDGDVTAPYNKSAHGKWKRRKGPAPALPIPPRKVLQMLPLQEIRHELEIIEVQQQGLEKQGVILEKMIRDRCEGQNGELLGAAKAAGESEDAADGRKNSNAQPPESVQNTKEVEDLILQLFELVNEKNELFRRQAELMYLRRQHRLEQEQADLEYEIRVLMAQPERNKTDTDKAREETLIARLVEVVQLRNEVIECLEMDRLREAEEDLSIKQRLELHTAQREGDADAKKTSAKLSKKEKKKQKESKKLSKSKKIDADKDADESELGAERQKLKKKKKKLFF